MSDGTKSEYTKTGKKVMCISSNRRDLTYRKVYDVFVDNDGYEFVIDDVGDKRYESLEFPYWCENPDGMVDKANETKHKSKAGKKVKSIYDGRDDLTYNKVYDVFIDNDGDEFIIDDVGDKRYWSNAYDNYYELVDSNETKPKFKVDDTVIVKSTSNIPTNVDGNVKIGDVAKVVKVYYIGNGRGSVDLHCENWMENWNFPFRDIELINGADDSVLCELFDDVSNDINISNETKPKFEVGDKVKVVDDGNISAYTHEVKVGDVGVIININNNGLDPYQVKFDDYGVRDNWWFTDKCIELIVDDTIENDNTTTDETKHKFKVGDKVKVVDTEQISTYTNSVRVNDVGVITTTKSLKTLDSYLVTLTFDGNAEQESWWFTDKCIELVENVTDDVNIENQTTKSESVVVRKFKTGDKVKILSTNAVDGISNHGVKVGMIGEVVEADERGANVKHSNFKLGWWFTDKCIELVGDDTKPIENESSPIKSDGNQIVSDGGSSSYYAQQIPKGMLERFNATGTIEAKDVIRLFLGNDFNMGNIFKAYCRVISLRNGKGKAGIDEQYDLTKAKFFTEDELNYYLENKDV